MKKYDEQAIGHFWADIVTAGLHPFPFRCVFEILKWVESGEYNAPMNSPESATT